MSMWKFSQNLSCIRSTMFCEYSVNQSIGASTCDSCRCQLHLHVVLLNVYLRTANGNVKEAYLREAEVVDALVKGGQPYFSDPVFPASGDSLYRTPQQPSAGTIPPSLVAWGRLSRQEVRRCHTPSTFPAEGKNTDC